MAYDATSLAKMIRTRQISASELMTETLKKIDRLNPKLNAVIHRRDEQAKKESRNKISEGPFSGVPTLLKILGQSLEDEPETGSSPLMKDVVAPMTDNYVKSLKHAGFLLAGQTNAPEFGFKNITDSTLYGTTKNAWNTEFSPGGSSGGAASAVASDMVALAGASDGGGSIRIPASFSGLIGLKPTRGRIPVGPGEWRGWQGAAINFALTRSIRDTKTLLEAIQTVQPAAPFNVELITADEFKQALPKKIRIAYSYASPVGTKVSEEAVRALRDAVEFLDSLGFETIEDTPDINGVDLMKSYYMMNGAETAAMFDEIEDAIGRKTTPKDMQLTTWTIYQAGKLISAADYSQSLNYWDTASYAADRFMIDYDLYLTPTTAYPAPRIDQELVMPETTEKMEHVTDLDKNERLDLIWEFFERSLTLSPFTQQANITGQPALSLPTHVTSSGMPMGIQFTGRKGSEALLLQMGQLFEENQRFHMLYPTEQV